MIIPLFLLKISLNEVLLLRGIINMIRKIKWLFQKIFRKSHLSDPDLWELFMPISKKIYLGLKDFKKIEKYGHPTNINSIEDWEKWINEQIEAWEFLMYENYECPFNTEKKHNEYEIKLFGKTIDFKNDTDFKLYEDKLLFFQEKRKHLMDYFENLWD